MYNQTAVRKLLVSRVVIKCFDLEKYLAPEINLKHTHFFILSFLAYNGSLRNYPLFLL